MRAIVDIATAAALSAGELVTSCFGKTAIEEKDSSYNLVTEADRRSEDLIVNFLQREMPESAVLGEENHHEGALTANRLWIVDPLDGTTNFAHGVPHFGISIAYAEKGRLLAGVIYDPMRNECFSASLGTGALLDGSPIRVSESRALEQSLIATGFYYDRDLTMDKTLAALHRLFKRNIRCMRRMGAASLDLTWLACGRFDGYFEYTLSSWDFAAGLLILSEAGGVASDITGRQADLFSKGLLCSNGLIHPEFLACTLNPGVLHVENEPSDAGGTMQPGPAIA